MASTLGLLSRTSAVLGIGLGLSFSLLPSSPFRAAPLQTQYSSSLFHSRDSGDSQWSISPSTLASSRQETRGGFLTASNMRQISLGSVLGLVVGVGLRAFSSVLVVLFGIGIVGVEWAASKGYNVLPLNRLQKYLKSVDLHGAMARHVPFKVTFGATMALAAFAHF